MKANSSGENKRREPREGRREILKETASKEIRTTARISEETRRTPKRGIWRAANSKEFCAREAVYGEGAPRHKHPNKGGGGGAPGRRARKERNNTIIVRPRRATSDARR